MELRYIGPHDAVEVPLPDGSQPEVEHGHPHDFPKEYALLLLEQPTNWEPATKPSPTEELLKLKREQLNQIASEAGIEHPEQLENKQAVVDALAAANEGGE